MKPISLISILLITCFFSFGQTATKCGTWRWNVKTLTDNSGIDWFSLQPINSTIDELVAQQPPKKLSTQSAADGMLPRYPEEKKLVKIQAYVTDIKSHEKDHDYHFVLQSPGTESEMDGEMPDPQCPEIASAPDLKQFFENIRTDGQKVIDAFKKSNKAILVEIVGVPFWDAAHGQAGGAPNAREIHPITSIRILDNIAGLAEGSQPAANNPNSITPPPNNKSNPSPMEPINTPLNTLIIILIGAILGAVGQGIRVIVGVKKVNDNAVRTNTAVNDSMDYRQMAFSVIIAFAIGAVAGVLATVATDHIEFNKATIIAFITAGYAGTDFIEGFIKKYPNVRGSDTDKKNE